MGFDLFPLTTLETRKRIYRQAVEEQWMVLFEHDPQQPVGYLKEDGKGYSVRPVDWDE
jgi:hypothetical protein